MRPLLVGIVVFAAGSKAQSSYVEFVTRYEDGTGLLTDNFKRLCRNDSEVPPVHRPPAPNNGGAGQG